MIKKFHIHGLLFLIFFISPLATTAQTGKVSMVKYTSNSELWGQCQIDIETIPPQLKEPYTKLLSLYYKIDDLFPPPDGSLLPECILPPMRHKNWNDGRVSDEVELIYKNQQWHLIFRERGKETGHLKFKKQRDLINNQLNVFIEMRASSIINSDPENEKELNLLSEKLVSSIRDNVKYDGRTPAEFRKQKIDKLSNKIIQSVHSGVVNR